MTRRPRAELMIWSGLLEYVDAEGEADLLQKIVNQLQGFTDDSNSFLVE